MATSGPENGTPGARPQPRPVADDTVYGRIAKLWAMTDSPVEEEARTAAMLLVRLAKRYGLALHDPRSCSPIRGRLTAEDFGAPPAQDPRAPPVMREARFYESYYAGRCRACRGTYQVGDPIWWARDRRGEAHVTHTTCAPAGAYWVALGIRVPDGPPPPSPPGPSEAHPQDPDRDRREAVCVEGCTDVMRGARFLNLRARRKSAATRLRKMDPAWRARAHAAWVAEFGADWIRDLYREAGIEA